MIDNVRDDDVNIFRYVYILPIDDESDGIFDTCTVNPLSLPIVSKHITISIEWSRKKEK